MLKTISTVPDGTRRCLECRRSRSGSAQFVANKSNDSHSALIKSRLFKQPVRAEHCKVQILHYKLSATKLFRLCRVFFPVQSLGIFRPQQEHANRPDALFPTSTCRAYTEERAPRVCSTEPVTGGPTVAEDFPGESPVAAPETRRAWDTLKASSFKGWHVTM